MVSVILSTFNDSPEYLEKAINSILNQSYQNFELIICNDCSTNPATLSVIEKYSANKKVVVIANEHNAGLAASLNRCISVAKGEFIARMDGDDVAEIDRLETELKLLENSDYDFVSSSALVIDEKDNIIGKISHLQTPTFNDVIKNVCFVHPCSMFKKKIFDSLGYESNINTIRGRCEDYDLWCRLYHEGYRGYNIEKTLLKYRETKAGLNKRTFKTRWFLFKQKSLNIKNYKNEIGVSLFYLIPQFLLLFIPTRVRNHLHNRKVRKCLKN